MEQTEAEAKVIERNNQDADSTKRIIAELCVDAPSKEIKDILRSSPPIIIIRKVCCSTSSAKLISPSFFNLAIFAKKNHKKTAICPGVQNWHPLSDCSKGSLETISAKNPTQYHKLCCWCATHGRTRHRSLFYNSFSNKVLTCPHWGLYFCITAFLFMLYNVDSVSSRPWFLCSRVIQCSLPTTMHRSIAQNHTQSHRTEYSYV